MGDFQVLNKQNLFISVTPFALKGICCLTEKLLLNFFHENHSWIARIKDMNHNLSMILTSYLLFTGVMVALSLIIAQMKAGGIRNKTNPKKQTRNMMMFLCKLVTLYTLIFGCFQGISSISSDKSSDLGLFQVPSLRKLDQYNIELEEDDDWVERLNPSSSINSGEILGSFPLQERGIKNPSLALSKDGKTLYILAHTYDSEAQILTIFNVSNPGKQKELKSIDLKPYLNFRLLEADLLLSIDEKSLFVLTCNGLIILDVSNLSSPSSIFVDDFLAGWDSQQLDQSSLALSSDGNILYAVTQRDLRIYNVSQPKHPDLLYNETSNFTGTLDISKDNQRIVIGLSTKIDILNVGDPRNPLLMASANLKGRIFSIAFSDDEKTIILGVSFEIFRDVFRLDLVIFKVKSPDELVLNYIQTLSMDDKWNNYGLWFHESKNYAIFNTRNEIKMIKIEENQQPTLFQTDSGVLNCASIRSWREDRTVVVFSETFSTERIFIIRLNIEIAPKSLVHFKPNALQILDEKDYDRKFTMALSRNETDLYLVKAVEAKGDLLPYKIRDNILDFKFHSVFFDSFADPGSHWVADATWNVDVRKNLAVVTYKSAFSVRSDLHVINISAASRIWTWSVDKRGLLKIGETALAANEKILCFLGSQVRDGNKSWVLNAMSFRDRSFNFSVEKFEISSCDCSNMDPRMKLSNDARYLFYVDCCNLMIYNMTEITTTTTPVLESSLMLNLTKAFALTLSRDETILYLLRMTASGEKKLEIFEISDIKTPKILSSILIDSSKESTESLELSLNERVLFIGFTDGVLMIDVESPENPKLFGYNYFASKKHALKLAKTKNAFYSASENGVMVYNMTFEYILHLVKSDYEIGESHESNLFVVKLNKNLKFDFLAKEHKFQKVSLFEAQSFKVLPNWITFDKEKSTLKIEPNSASTKGKYKIAVTLSVQTKYTDFMYLEFASNNTLARELMLDLIQSGYLDSHGYLSENFDLNQQLWINSKFQIIEKEVRAILSRNYIQAIAEITVASSLSLLEAKPLKISSRSKGDISVAIKLDRTEGSTPPQFITRSYPYVKATVIKEKSELLLEGSLEYVNEALNQVVVDLQGGGCNGAINIKDGINPPINRGIREISNYFAVNTRPVYNNLTWSLEKQLANTSRFYTGLYSVIEFHPRTFTDMNNLTLEYSLLMQDSNKAPPSWISMKGLSLVGTPPESYSLSYDLILVAKNEFQNTTVPFTLDIHISFYYGVRLVITFGGYLFTLVGFILTVNKIYNLVARKYYRYPRSFKLRCGDEINDSKIFPISFVKNEIVSSEKIFKLLNGEHYDFIEDKQRIIKALEEYGEVVKQLVMNKFVTKQLNDKRENTTKKLFEKIKDKWMDLILVPSSENSQFIINSVKLGEILSEYKEFDQDETNMSLGESTLLQKKKYNLELLENAIIAHAFTFQNLDIDTIKIDVVSHKKLVGRSLWIMIKRFLLRDLEVFNFLNKREIGYGIEYKIENNTMRFTGKLTNDLGQNIVVVHIKNKRGRILRELSITGAEENGLAVSRVSNISEIIL